MKKQKIKIFLGSIKYKIKRKKRKMSNLGYAQTNIVM